MLVHELRSPAAASKSMVATFRFLHRQDSHLDSSLAKIEDRMDQLLSLVGDILTLSQARAEHWLGSRAVLELVAETRTVCRPYLEEAAAKGLAMSMKLPESPVRVHMAEGAYQLIVSNLVSSAVKYTSIGSVRVSLREEGAWAEGCPCTARPPGWAASPAVPSLAVLLSGWAWHRSCSRARACPSYPLAYWPLWGELEGLKPRRLPCREEVCRQQHPPPYSSLGLRAQKKMGLETLSHPRSNGYSKSEIRGVRRRGRRCTAR
jgi:hypothetical protein